MSEICPVCQSPVAPGSASCPQCGFKLLGATEKFEPVTFDENARIQPADRLQHATLHVVRGPQAGVSYRLSGDELTIGRSPQCSIFLNDMTVSRMHAVLTREDSCYVIRDENSYNGVWVNNQSVEAKALKAGDFIQIGTFCLMYEENESE